MKNVIINMAWLHNLMGEIEFHCVELIDNQSVIQVVENIILRINLSLKKITLIIICFISAISHFF